MFCFQGVKLMQKRRTILQSKPSRHGFTLIELLVVISIIATLMALILPAIQQARAAARRTECQNNMKNIALAAHNFASSKKGALPPLGVYGPDAASASSTYSGLHSWVVKLLPYMDARAVYDQWQQDQSWNSGTNSLVNRTYMKVLACPDDETSVNVGGGLSYVANAGYLLDGLATTNPPVWVEPGVDWNGNGNISAAGAADLDTNDSDLNGTVACSGQTLARTAIQTLLEILTHEHIRKTQLVSKVPMTVDVRQSCLRKIPGLVGMEAGLHRPGPMLALSSCCLQLERHTRHQLPAPTFRPVRQLPKR